VERGRKEKHKRRSRGQREEKGVLLEVMLLEQRIAVGIKKTRDFSFCSELEAISFLLFTIADPLPDLTFDLQGKLLYAIIITLTIK